MSPSLDSISVELLDNILSFVQPPSALCKLALVSWKFNTLTTPHLYRHVSLESDLPNGGFRHMLPFTSLILRKPSIASLVRSFTFRGLFHNEDSLIALAIDPNSQLDYDNDEMRLPWPDHPELDDILRRVIGEISHSEEEELEWNREVLPRYAPKDTAIFALLLISFPNLRLLDMEIGSFEDDFLERIFYRIAFSEPPFDVKPVFTQLTDIMIASYDDRYPSAYIFFDACCRLPAVKRIYGYRLGAEEDRPLLSGLEGATSLIETSESHDSSLHLDNSPRLSGLGGATSRIETLELRDSKLHHLDLPIVFGALRSPQTIIYHTGNSWAWTPVRAPDILSAVAIHAASLRRLAIDHEDYYPFEEGVGSDDNADPISFVGFIALSHLRVAPVFLFGHEDLHNAPEPGSVAETAMLNRLRGALPLNLETLYVTNADFVFSDEHAHIAEAFEVLLRHKESVPHLRELVFEGQFKEGDSVWHSIEMARLGTEVGVVVRGLHRTHYAYDEQQGWGWDEEVSFEPCMHNYIGERVQGFP